MYILTEIQRTIFQVRVQGVGLQHTHTHTPAGHTHTHAGHLYIFAVTTARKETASHVDKALNIYELHTPPRNKYSSWPRRRGDPITYRYKGVRWFGVLGGGVTRYNVRRVRSIWPCPRGQVLSWLPGLTTPRESSPHTLRPRHRHRPRLYTPLHHSPRVHCPPPHPDNLLWPCIVIILCMDNRANA